MNQEPLWHDAFYQLVSLPDPQAMARSLQQWARALTGCLWVAPHGLNGALAGTAGALEDFRRQLLSDPQWGPLCKGMLFNRSACHTPPFQRLKVASCKALLPLSWPLETPAGVQTLSPPAWQALIRDTDTVLIDNRNSFEFRLGRFHGAINPQVQHFRDFPAFVQSHIAGWRAQGRRVAMYCTGGIRCDITQGWMQAQGLEVFTLQGGILNYFAHLPHADQDWDGECFVFDNRIALNTQLQETSTRAEDVFTTSEDAWRLARAQKLRSEPVI